MSEENSRFGGSSFGGRRGGDRGDRFGGDRRRGGGGGRGDRFGGDRRRGGGGRDNFRGGRESSPPEEDVNVLFKNQQSSGISFDRYEDIPVEVEGKDVPEAISNFADMDLHPSLVRNIELCKYSKPTPVQKYSYPISKLNRDLMSCAQTGSGKTARFLLPIVDHLLKENVIVNPTRPGQAATPVALIISPTRELANQIYDESRKFAYKTHIKSVAIYGGRNMQKQLSGLKVGAHIVIGTPGRITDLVQRGYLSLSNVSFFVLDEADCMLDMGFEPQIRTIVNDFDLVPTEKRQTLLFSATFPKEIRNLARDFLKRDYIFLTVGRVGAAAESVEQIFENVEEMNKTSELLKLFTTNEATSSLKSIVFVKRKIDVDQIVDALRGEGVKALSIHGDKSQQQRERALKIFKDGKASVLVATDVAARGLDIRGIDHVINYDMPDNMDSYVHRIGRTGRVGHSGKSTTFINGSNGGIINELVKECEKNSVQVPDFLYELGKRRGGRGFGGGGRYGGNRYGGGGYRGGNDRRGNGGFGGGFERRGGFGGGRGGGGNFNGSSRFTPY